MKRVVLVTGHYLASRRRAGFHWLADAYWRAGWEVLFFTAGVSRALWLRGRDPRLEYPLAREANRIRWLEPRLGSYVWLKLWHPSATGSAALDRWLMPLFRRYGALPLGEAEPLVRAADLAIFESTPGLMLAERFRRLHPGARLVYRVSDDVRLLGYHPVVLEAEERLAPIFDLISCPSRSVLARLAPLGRAVFQPQGIRKELFDAPCSSPFGSEPGPHLVFVGNSHFDYDFLDRAARLFPRWRFHIIGPIPDLPARSNVVSYGELAFGDTIPYLRHADVGLNIRAGGAGLECLRESSLKVLQYTYCRLPIVAPERLRSEGDHVFCYQPGDDASIAAALAAAAAFDHARVDRAGIRSWDEVAALLAGERRAAPVEVGA